MNRVLIIDDEPFVREALKRVLEGDGVSVDTAADANSALAQLRAQPADLVIIDVIMPGMDGVQLIRQLRADYPGVRIVAISGGGNFELGGYRPDAISTRAYLAAATKAGADAALAKPFDTAELEAVIRPLLKPSAPAQPRG
jgi:CheY-like chemotaxis protein